MEILTPNFTIVESEATEILYGNNTWRITSLFPSSDAIWRKRSHLFKHVVMVFSQRDVHPDALLIESQNEHEYDTDSETDQQAQQRDLMNRMHDHARFFMSQSWNTRINCINQMPNLITVQLDVATLYCHAGCCRRAILKFLLRILCYWSGYVSLGMSSKRPQVEKCVRGIRNDMEMQLAQERGFSTEFA